MINIALSPSVLNTEALKALFESSIESYDSIKKMDSLKTLITMIIGFYFLGPYFGRIAPSIVSSLTSMTIGATVLFTPQILRGIYSYGSRALTSTLDMSSSLLNTAADTFKRTPPLITKILVGGVGGGAVLFMFSQYFKQLIDPQVLLASAKALLEKIDGSWLGAAMSKIMYCLSISNVNITESVQSKIANFVNNFVSSAISWPTISNLFGQVQAVNSDFIDFNNQYIFGYKPTTSAFSFTTTANYITEAMSGPVGTFSEYMEAARTRIFGETIVEETWTSTIISPFAKVIAAAYTWMGEVKQYLYELLSVDKNISELALASVIPCVSFTVAGILASWLCYKLYTYVKSDALSIPVMMKEYETITLAAANNIRLIFNILIIKDVYKRESAKDLKSSADVIRIINEFLSMTKRFLSVNITSKYTYIIAKAFEEFRRHSSTIGGQQNLLAFLKLLQKLKTAIESNANIMKKNGSEQEIMRIDEIVRFVIADLVIQEELVTKKINGVRIVKKSPAIDRALFKLIKASEATNMRVGANNILEDLAFIRK